MLRNYLLTGGGKFQFLGVNCHSLSWDNVSKIDARRLIKLALLEGPLQPLIVKSPQDHLQICFAWFKLSFSWVASLKWLNRSASCRFTEYYLKIMTFIWCVKTLIQPETSEFHCICSSVSSYWSILCLFSTSAGISTWVSIVQPNTKNSKKCILH